MSLWRLRFRDEQEIISHGGGLGGAESRGSGQIADIIIAPSAEELSGLGGGLHKPRSVHTWPVFLTSYTFPQQPYWCMNNLKECYNSNKNSKQSKEMQFPSSWATPAIGETLMWAVVLLKTLIMAVFRCAIIRKYWAEVIKTGIY